jgi:hypothetical protein
VIVSNNVFYDGIATLENKPNYQFQFQSQGFIDLLTIETCHQYKTYTKEKILKRKYLDIEYTPMQLEKEKVACPMFISSYEKDKGRHSFGIIEFKRDQYQLKYQLECDGKKISDQGVALCQSKVGTTQRLTFEIDTSFVSSKKCKETIKKIGNYYEIKVIKDLCIFTFKSESKFARLTTFGFESVLVY